MGYFFLFFVCFSLLFGVKEGGFSNKKKFHIFFSYLLSRVCPSVAVGPSNVVLLDISTPYFLPLKGSSSQLFKKCFSNTESVPLEHKNNKN